MARLYKRRGSPKWQAGVWVDGQEVRLSCKTDDRATAERILPELERRLRLSADDLFLEESLKWLGLDLGLPGRNHGFVYLIGLDERPHLVKVGWTGRDALTRLRSLQTASPFPLSLLERFPGSIHEEQRILMALADSRVKGEWISLNYDDRYDLRRTFRLLNERRDVPPAPHGVDWSTISPSGAAR